MSYRCKDSIFFVIKLKNQKIFYLPWGQAAMGTGTWQQQLSANGCQVLVPWQDAVASPNSAYYAPLSDA